MISRARRTAGHERSFKRAGVLDARGRDALPDVVALVGIPSEGLFAKDVLSRLGGSDRRLGMERIRALLSNSPIAGLSTISRQSVVHRSYPYRLAAPATACRSRPAIATSLGINGGGHVMYCDLAERIRVRLAHERVPEHPDPDLLDLADAARRRLRPDSRLPVAHARAPLVRGIRLRGYYESPHEREENSSERDDHDCRQPPCRGGPLPARDDRARMKTSLGIWAFGPMITRFIPVGYQPELTNVSTADKVRRAVQGLGDLMDDYEFHYPYELSPENLDEVREALDGHGVYTLLRPASRPAVRSRRPGLARPGDTRRSRAIDPRGGGFRRLDRRAVRHLARLQGYNYPFQTPTPTRGSG